MTELTKRTFSRVEYHISAGSAFRHAESLGGEGDAMPVAVSRRRTAGHGQRVQIVFPTESAAPGLMHDCRLGAGVRVRVNAANPGQWQVIWVDAWNDHARPLLTALIGPGAVQQLDNWSDSQSGPGADLDWIGSDWAGQHPEGSGSATSGWDDQILGTGADAPAAIDLRAAEPWLRVAAVDVLDRWLHLPLNQALVDAERGVVRAYAARTLELGRARSDVLADALRLARAASCAFVEYLGRLARSPHPVPESLRKVLGDLIEGYQVMAAELPEPDQQLRSVVKLGRGVLDRLPAGVDENRSRALRDAGCTQKAALTPGLVTDVISLIDPRQIPARMLRLSMEPASGEVRMRVTRANGRDAVVVEAPAYEPGNGNLRGGSAGEQLSVRLIDKMTGADVDGAVLTLESSAEHSSPVFRAFVPLPEVDLHRLRADVYDGTSDEPPAPSDADPDLLSVRKTAALLAGWRRLAAAVRVGEFQPDATAQVRAVSGDPEATAEELTEDGEPVLSAGAATRRAMIAGAGDLLVAEVNAASGLIAS